MLKTLVSPLSYFYFDGEKKDAAQLDVTGFDSAESKMASIPEYLEKHKSANMIINFPNAANFDIVIIDGSGDSHGIQVTTQTKAAKCLRSSFYESTDCNFKYILTSELDDFTILDAKNAFIDGFKVHELRVIKAIQVRVT
jgi:hypothetical protein